MRKSLQGRTCLVFSLQRVGTNVFSAVLKELTVSVDRTSAGSLFQAIGPDMVNHLVPKYIEVIMMMRLPWVADCSLCLLP